MAGGFLVRSDEEILAETGPTSTRQYLDGFSEKAIERFFRPFFGGVLLDNELETSAPVSKQ